MCNIPYLSTQLDLLLTLRELPNSMNDLQPVSLLLSPVESNQKAESEVLKVCPVLTSLKKKSQNAASAARGETQNMQMYSIMQILMFRYIVALEINEKTIWGQTDINT